LISEIKDMSNEEIENIKENFNKRLSYRSDALYETHLNRLLLGAGLCFPTGPFGVVFLTGSAIFLLCDSSITGSRMLYYKLKTIRNRNK